MVGTVVRYGHTVNYLLNVQKLTWGYLASLAVGLICRRGRGF